MFSWKILSPGLMDRLGLDYRRMISLNPRLVYCSISGFGQTGPYRDRPGYDQILQGMSGLMSITGTEESGPVRVGLAIGDILTALFATYGILSALWAREKTGKGQWVTTSIPLEATVGILTMQAGKFFATGQPPGPAGNHHPIIAPYGVYRTKDKPINIAVGTETMWKNFCRVTGRPELEKDERFRKNNDRVKNRSELNPLLEEVLAAKTQEEWIEALNQAGIPCWSDLHAGPGLQGSPGHSSEDASGSGTSPNGNGSHDRPSGPAIRYSGPSLSSPSAPGGT